MFGKRLRIFRLLGFSVYVDLSWFLILTLVVWSLAVGWFPQTLPGRQPATYWWMAAAGALLFFLSIIAHEFAHSVVARRRGLPMKGITLFLFGGVSEMSEEPADASTELLMAIAGPITSFVIAGVCYGLESLGSAASWPIECVAILGYLAFINLVLGVFNMIPAFPLDGGRVLRAILWHWKGNLRRATRITAQIGSGFGALMIVLAVVSLLLGNLMTGMWWFLIGMFLRGAARASYQQLLAREALQGLPVRKLMHDRPVTVPSSLTVRQLVDDYVYRYHFKMFPIVDGDKLVGCVRTRDIKDLPREQWDHTRVIDVGACDLEAHTIGADEDATKALARMNRLGISRLMVVDDARLVGVLSLKDLMRLFALKVELEDEDEGKGNVARPPRRARESTRPEWIGHERHA